MLTFLNPDTESIFIVSSEDTISFYKKRLQDSHSTTEHIRHHSSFIDNKAYHGTLRRGRIPRCMEYSFSRAVNARVDLGESLG